MAFKICTVGCGDLSFRMHGPAFQKYAMAHPDTELTACCDIDETPAREFQQNFGFQRWYVDMEEMLRLEQPDAVILMVPVALTAQYSCQILNKRIPLLLEKPPGRTPAELEQIITAAAASHTPARVAFNRRYAPLVQHFKKRINDSTDPQSINYLRCDFYRSNRRDTDFSTTAIHGIDTLRFIAAADYKQLNFSYQEFPELGEKVTNIYLNGSTSTGAIVQLNFCPNSGVVLERHTVQALDHTFLLNIPVWGEFDSPGQIQHFFQNKLVYQISGNQLPGGTETYISNGFYGETAAFLNAVRNDAPATGDIHDARQAVAVADCIRQRKKMFSIADNGGE